MTRQTRERLVESHFIHSAPWAIHIIAQGVKNVKHMAEKFSNEVIQAVWEKGQVVHGKDPSKVRKDVCKAWIHRDEYGNRNSDYGWEIDHITPISNGGPDALYNLRPLQWENNASKQNGRLTCPVTAA